LDILNDATSFIIVGGYNFTFKTAGYTFFNILRKKVSYGIPVLMIIPTNLAGPWSNQPKIINYCNMHGIGIILNGNNHSKWLLTENDLYYGSSNFTETSWKQRVEVVTIHKHSNIQKNWKYSTVLDFRKFVQREIVRLNKRKAMKNIPGLITHTITVWKNIKPLVKKLNPSIEKVIQTLQNYHLVEQMIEELTAEWFAFYPLEIFEQIYKMNSDLLFKINGLCEFAYFHIYNEFTEIVEFEDVEVINEYNSLYNDIIISIENDIINLSDKSDNILNISSNFTSKNDELIELINSRITIDDT
jgi:hypothetical protein